MILQLPGRTLRFEALPRIMGILNLTDDSFSGDGTLDPNRAVEIAVRLVREGADFLDVGAESARTNREPIPVKEEIARLLPFLDAWRATVATLSPRDSSQIFPPVLSLNTWRPEVVREVLPAGVELLNDMGGLPDPANAAICAETGVALLIMHTVGLPKQNHSHIQHENLLADLDDFFERKIAMALEAGVSREAIVLDPGLGFAKQTRDDLLVLANIHTLQRFERPLLLPISRKGLIGEVLGVANPADRDAGTVGVFASVPFEGGLLFRAHNVDALWLARKTLGALQPGLE